MSDEETEAVILQARIRDAHEIIDLFEPMPPRPGPKFALTVRGRLEWFREHLALERERTKRLLGAVTKERDDLRAEVAAYQLREHLQAPDLAWLEAKLRPWANILYSRFGHPVYLVGSALTHKNPRDIDIRVVLPDDEFKGRYGPWTGIRSASLGTWTPEMLRWAEECGKQNRWAAKHLGLNIDFQVQAEQEVEAQHANGTRLLLSSTMPPQ